MAQIVLVEDNSELRALFAGALGRAGHLVRQARTGCEGLQLHRVAPADVLVVDLCTPELSGAEAIARLRSTGDATPVVAISGAGFILDASPPRRTMSTALESGADAFLPKPFNSRALLGCIRRLLGDEQAFPYEAED